MNFFRLFHRYIIRDLVRHRSQAALTVSGIALGISVVVAVHLANDRATRSFNDSLRLLSGQADLEITSNGLPLPEETIRQLAWVWDYGSMSSIVEGRARLTGDEESIQIFGVDLLSENTFRRYVLDDAAELTEQITRDEFIDLLLDPKKAIVTDALAQRHSLVKGASFPVLLGDRRHVFTVGAVLANDGAARAFSGNVIFLDIAAAQLALGKIGSLDRIDVRLRDRARLADVRRRIEASVPATAVVDAPEAAAVRNEKLSRAFRYNLTALSYISLIVGVILIYNTLSIAVVRRQAEIGMLRMLGVGRQTIAALFLVEAACLGLAGATIGIVLGEILSVGTGLLVMRTMQSLYTGIETIPAVQVQPAFYAAVIASGILLSIISGLAPAIRATRVSPVSIVRVGMAFAGRAPRTRALALAGVVVIVVAAVIGQQPPVFDFPFFGYVCAILLIAGFGLLAPAFSRMLLAIIAPLLTMIFPIEGKLAAGSMTSSLRRVVTAVLSLAIAVGMLMSVVTMVSSFRDTVIVWINQTLRADLYVRAAAAGANDWSNPFDPKTVDALADLPVVAAMDRFRGRPLVFNGADIVLGAGEFSVLARHSDLLFMDGRSSAEIAPRMMNQSRVIVSEPLAVKHRLSKGDVVTLPTARGMQPFVIEAVYYDYSNDSGLVVMDRSTYLQFFEDASITNIALYLRPGVDAVEAQQVIARALPDSQLRVVTNAGLKQQVLRVFDQTFQVTYALEAIALIVAILGITNTLSALILERRPEFAMLRFVGTDRKQLRNVVVIESGLIGVIGVILGLAIGIALSFVLVFVINKQSFGWTIQFALPVGFAAQSLTLIVLATIVGGLYPAAIASRMDPLQSIRAE
jgi:putative ABC transport system permease protein